MVRVTLNYYVSSFLTIYLTAQNIIDTNGFSIIYGSESLIQSELERCRPCKVIYSTRNRGLVKTITNATVWMFDQYSTHRNGRTDFGETWNRHTQFVIWNNIIDLVFIWVARVRSRGQKVDIHIIISSNKSSNHYLLNNKINTKSFQLGTYLLPLITNLESKFTTDEHWIRLWTILFNKL